MRMTINVTSIDDLTEDCEKLKKILNESLGLLNQNEQLNLILKLNTLHCVELLDTTSSDGKVKIVSNLNKLLKITNLQDDYVIKNLEIYNRGQRSKQIKISKVHVDRK